MSDLIEAGLNKPAGWAAAVNRIRPRARLCIALKTLWLYLLTVTDTRADSPAKTSSRGTSPEQSAKNGT